MQELIQGDCLEKMKDITDGAIDLVLTDPPYGTTACKWDTVIPFEPMWEQLKRVTKKNGVIALFGSQPFTSALVMSNPKMFKYEWVWEKQQGTNPLLAKKQPLRKTENISVFYQKQPTYNPQMTKGKPYSGFRDESKSIGIASGGAKSIHRDNPTGDRYPTNIVRFNTERTSKHPTQKPVALMEYLIKTYTKERETVLDFTMGSGTTGVACKNLNRNFIGIELDSEYFRIAEERTKNIIQ